MRLSIILVMYVFFVFIIINALCDSYNVVPASDVMDKFKNGTPILYNRVIIEGSINVSLLPEFNGYINSKINITNSIIADEVNFNSAIFNNSLNFANTIFRNSVSYRECEFNRTAQFESAHFIKIADFTETIFRDGVNFLECEFNRTAKFNGAHFIEIADFGFSKFNSDAQFKKSHFDKECIFEGITIDRVADFTNSVISKCYYENARFNGPVDFTNSIFEQDAYFRYSKFNGITQEHSTIFENTIFKNKLDFDEVEINKIFFLNSTFHNETYFRNCIFRGEAQFSDCLFSGTTTLFDALKFYGNAYFINTSFTNKTIFSGSIFFNDAIIDYSRFDSIEFRDIEFEKIASFKEAIFNNKARFIKSKFFDVSFEMATFKGLPISAEFTGSQFNKSANFLSSTFFGDANFNNAKFNDVALLENTLFNKDLSLTKTDYEQFYIRWENIKGRLLYNETAYSKLIENFKILGLFDDSNECYYSFMVEYSKFISNDFINHTVEIPIYFFSDLLYGFGTKPGRPVSWSLFFIIVVFWPIWYKAMKRAKVEEYCSKMQKWHCLRESHIFDWKWKSAIAINALGFSSLVFISGTKFFIDAPALPSEFDQYSPHFKHAFIIERILGGIFSILFFFAIGKSVFAG